MFVRRLALVSLSTVLAVGSVSALEPETASAADTGGTPIVVDLPPTVRAFPRITQILTEIPSGGLYLRREGALEPNHSQGELATVFRDADGTETPATAPTFAAGDHGVFAPAAPGEPWTMRDLPDGDVRDLTALADGGQPLGATSDGVLTRTGSSGAQSLSLVPWSGAAPTPLPVTSSAWSDLTVSTTGEHGAVLSGAAEGTVYVDTVTGESWRLPAAAATAGSLSIGGDRLAWIDAPGQHLMTTALPSASTPVPPVATEIALPADFLDGTTYDLKVLVVADRLIVWHGQTTRGQVLSFSSTGDPTTLLSHGGDVHVSGADGIVAVGGDDVDRPGVVRTPAVVSEPSTVFSLEPVSGLLYGIAVDGDRVISVDNSVGATWNMLKQTTVDFGTRSVGPTTTLGSDIAAANCNGGPVAQCTGVVASGGATVWADLSRTRGWHQIDAEGKRTDGTSWPLYPRRLDGHLIQISNGNLLDLSTDTLTADTMSALENGIAYYTSGTFSQRSPSNVIVEKELATGRTAVVAVPGCATVGVRDVVGTWASLACYHSDTGQASEAVAFDLADPTQAPLPLGKGEDVLGNGFVLRRDTQGGLWWTALTGMAVEWRLLGPVGDGGFAASTGRRPTAAWVSPNGRAHAALLPVPTGSAPTDMPWTTAPSAPVSATSWDGSTLQVSWTDPPADQHVFEYAVAVDGQSVALDGSARSTSFAHLDPSVAHTVTVTARNFTGRTRTTSNVAALGSPEPPTGVHLSIDPATWLASVTWSWAPSSTTTPAEWFDVDLGDGSPVRLASSARSYQFTLTAPWHGSVTVAAGSGRGSSIPVASNTGISPGPDHARPTVTLAALKPVQAAAALTVVTGARDDRTGVTTSIRVRESAYGSSPAAWNEPRPASRTGRTAFTGLHRGSTYCFAAQATDAAGNTSSWSTPRCVAIALDQSFMRPGGRWKVVHRSEYLGGTSLRGTSRSSRLSLGSAATGDLWLLATTCRTCGVVDLTGKDGRVHRVRLRSATRHVSTWVRVPGGAVAGPITLRVEPGHGPVTIDGVGIVRL